MFEISISVFWDSISEFDISCKKQKLHFQMLSAENFTKNAKRCTAVGLLCTNRTDKDKMLFLYFINRSLT